MLTKEEPHERAEQVVAGLEKPLKALRELLLWPFLYSEEAAILGLQWPRGLLLHGPPGTGKTSLVRAMVKESGAHLIFISADTIHKAYVGESERLLREAFAEATAEALSGKPVVIFIDEIDVLCPRRDFRISSMILGKKRENLSTDILSVQIPTQRRMLLKQAFICGKQFCISRYYDKHMNWEHFLLKMQNVIRNFGEFFGKLMRGKDVIP